MPTPYGGKRCVACSLHPSPYLSASREAPRSAIPYAPRSFLASRARLVCIPSPRNTLRLGRVGIAPGSMPRAPPDSYRVALSPALSLSFSAYTCPASLGTASLSPSPLPLVRCCRAAACAPSSSASLARLLAAALSVVPMHTLRPSAFAAARCTRRLASPLRSPPQTHVR